MIIDTLITDRAQTDVDRVNELAAKWLGGTITNTEKAEWLAGLKGAYNYADMNRVGTAVEYLAMLLESEGKTVSVTAKKNWTMADVPTKAQEAAYLGDINALRALVTVTAVATPTTIDRMTFETANNIELILKAIYTAIQRETAGFVFSGAGICGAEGVL